LSNVNIYQQIQPKKLWSMIRIIDHVKQIIQPWD